MLGVNLVGHLEAESGIGEVARHLLTALDAAGVPVLPVSIDAPASPRRPGVPSARVPAAPFGTTVACLNAGQMPLVHGRLGRALVEGRRMVGVWWWETPAFPPDLAPAFAYVDEVWTGSAHVAAAVRRAAPADVPVVALPLHVAAERPVPPAERARLGLPGGVVFLCSFDHNSVLARKHPLGAIEAYRRAFPPGSGTALVVKSLNGDRHPAEHRRVLEAAAGRDDVLVRDGRVSPDERDALVASCDCYVSLHRAEGFGITLAEAMLFARPVIATGWSGNLEFTDDDTALLVRHRLVPVGPGAEPYAAEDVWAEPDLAHAAELMRAVAADPDAARRLGERGRRRVLERYAARRVGDALAARLREAGAAGRTPTAAEAEVVEALAAARRAGRTDAPEVLELEREHLAAERDGHAAALADAAARTADLERRAAALHASLSWRLTRPLRAGARRARAVRRAGRS
jgi:glycosyltransferase involved in cell wall biosynthesis